MANRAQNAAMLWTGGKDSSLALHEAVQAGHRVRCLVTLAPPSLEFLAHPLAVIKMQARALALPHYVVSIEPPYERAYEAGLRRLRDELAIDGLITGDLAEVSGYPNWIRERSRPLGMGVYTPLWGRDRPAVLRRLLALRFKALFTCVRTHWLSEKWIGRELDDSAMAELGALRQQTGLDMCGEEGEYHTLVIDGPRFKRRIDIRAYSTRVTESLAYMEVHELELVDREEPGTSLP